MVEILKSQDVLNAELGLENCAREPIHIPGAIQSHGVLFRLSEPDLIITHATDNCFELLGVAAEDLLNKQLSSILLDEFADQTVQNLLSVNVEKHNPQKIRLNEKFKLSQAFDCAAHRFKGNLIIELEPSAAMKPVEFTTFYHLARLSVQKLRSSKDLQQLLSTTVSEIRDVTGFDRVVIYQFDLEWNGHVVAQSANDKVESYFDLHFPASDIPKQVRDLFCMNRMRIIPDSSYKSSRILPSAFVDENRAPIDLSFANLRNVSPIHVEYLKNMKVTASMSMAVIKNNQLWGLISCSHESGPLFVPYDVRAVCDFLSETFSSLLPVHEALDDSSLRMRLADVQGQLLSRMTDSNPFIDGLIKNPDLYLELGCATGGAIYLDGEWFTIGLAPEISVLEKLRQIVIDRKIEKPFFTTTLANEIDEALEVKSIVSGVAAFSTSRALTNFFFWFKPEVIQTVNWGGNPNKPVELENGKMVLHPRKSFELWKETVRLTSEPWKIEEQFAINALRSSIIEVVLQKVERVTRLNTELERSNTELDSFAYAASHDLKEPLRGIHNYARIILRDSEDILSDESKERMGTILRLTQRSEDLINSLLDYSQIGRTDLVVEDADLNVVLSNALDSIRMRIDENHCEIKVNRLPTIAGDRVQLIEVFTNLISNAIKYNSSDVKTVEIGQARIDAESEFPVLFVKDNGIGIEKAHYPLIFKIFKRLHAKTKFGGGTGTGLTIAAKIIERHGGKIWVESIPKIGTTFFFTLGKSFQ